jgi:hypothetical protein
MDGLNHLREQGADTLVDKSLEEVYSLLIIQIQPEFLLKLMNAHHTRGKEYMVIGSLIFVKKIPKLVKQNKLP